MVPDRVIAAIGLALRRQGLTLAVESEALLLNAGFFLMLAEGYSKLLASCAPGEMLMLDWEDFQKWDLARRVNRRLSLESRPWIAWLGLKV